MAEKRNISPEEKLLNVIQGKEKTGAPAASDKTVADAKPQSPAQMPPAPAGQAGAPAKPPAPAQAPLPPRPAPAQGAAPAQPAAKPGAAASKAADKPVPKAAQATARPNLKAASANRLDVRSRTLATVNRLLRIGIVGMVGLCGWQMWTTSTAASAPEKTGTGRRTRPAIATAAPSESCSSVLPSFGGKYLFAPLVPETVELTVTNIEKKTTISEVQQYVSRNLKLIGVAPGKDGTIQEAILTDVQTRRNYFLKVGDKISLKNWTIDLKQVAADHAVFLCGKEEIKVP